MIVKIAKKEERIFMRLLFMGELMVNRYRLFNQSKKSYAHVNEKIMRAYLKELNQEVNEFTYDDLYEELMDETDELVSFYDGNAIYGTLAKMLAERDYPYTQGNSDEFLHHLVAHSIYDNQLEKNGLDIIKIEIPNFEQLFQRLSSAGMDFPS